jgi:hypothetical protein
MLLALKKLTRVPMSKGGGQATPRFLGVVSATHNLFISKSIFLMFLSFLIFIVF